jgi:threonine/homoserine/homoserine lactone efflux protein
MMMALASGAFLGLSCGLALGPLLALVLAARLGQLHALLGIVSLAGGAFVLYLAWENVRPVRLDADALGERPRSWLKGILTNLLNPHPWLFWLTVGAATLAKAIAQGWVVMRVLAVLLGVFALLLFREGLRHLAVI